MIPELGLFSAKNCNLQGPGPIPNEMDTKDFTVQVKPTSLLYFFMHRFDAHFLFVASCCMVNLLFITSFSIILIYTVIFPKLNVFKFILGYE